jgi:VWFA-related protein
LIGQTHRLFSECRMRGVLAVLFGFLALCPCVMAGAPAQEPGAPAAQTALPSTNAQAPPRFRGGTNLVQVDVSVLDGKRRPVSGLTASDFTILEDGKPRPIEGFTEVHLAARVPKDSAPWVRDVPRDVASNTTLGVEGRIVIILLDRSIPLGEPTQTARRIAAAAINELGPGDLAAVVSTSGGRSQNLTSDRTRLLRAIQDRDLSTGISSDAREIEEMLQASMGLPQRWTDLNDGRCLCGLCVLDTIARVADAVQEAPRRRKALLFIGSSMLLQSAGTPGGGASDVGCESRLTDARRKMFAAVDRANLTIHALDPSGLSNIGPISRTSSPLRGAGVGRVQQRDTNEFLQHQGELGVMPDRTGGRTVINTNAPESAMPAIFDETESYYLLGFSPSATDGNASHTISVTVNRRGLRVHARKGYTPEGAAQAGESAPAPNGSPAAAGALDGLLPRTDAPLDLAVAAFAAPQRGHATVALATDVRAFAPSADDEGGEAPAGGPVEVVAGAFDAGGRVRGGSQQRADLSAARGTPGRPVEVLSRIDLAPGDYELRVGASADGRNASVFTYVSIPPFDAAPLSLSTLVLGSTAGTVAGPRQLLDQLIPIVPTTQREFSSADDLIGFLRVYQGTARRDPLQTVELRSTVLDAQGKAVAGQAITLTGEQFAKDRSADQLFSLPLAGFAPGQYLLTVEARMGERQAGRAVRFTVR